MACKHERIRCTNNRFFCATCGVELPNPYKQTQEQQKGSEGARKPVKRTRKKEPVD